LYGTLRQSDFLPVGEPKDDEVLGRGVMSESSGSDDEGYGRAAAFGCGMHDSDVDDFETEEQEGNMLEETHGLGMHEDNMEVEFLDSEYFADADLAQL